MVLRLAMAVLCDDFNLKHRELLQPGWIDSHLHLDRLATKAHIDQEQVERMWLHME